MNDDVSNKIRVEKLKWKGMGGLECRIQYTPSESFDSTRDFREVAQDESKGSQNSEVKAVGSMQ